MQSTVPRSGRCWQTARYASPLVPASVSGSVPEAGHLPKTNARSRRRVYCQLVPDASANWSNEPSQESDCPAQRVCCTDGVATSCSMLLRQGALTVQRLEGMWSRYQQSHSGHALSKPLFAMGALVPTLSGADPIHELLNNHVLMTAFWAWFLAQTGKIFTHRFKKGVWDWRAIIQPGGTPSSHSSLCTGLTTALALTQGLGSPIFAVALAFSVIVMYDAMGVRQHAGKQAEVLNQVINELMDDHPLGEIKLKEVLGHTPRQVLAGAVLGVIIGLAYPKVLTMTA